MFKTFAKKSKNFSTKFYEKFERDQIILQNVTKKKIQKSNPSFLTEKFPILPKIAHGI